MTPTSARMDGDFYGMRLCNYPRHAAHTMEGRRAFELELIRRAWTGRIRGVGAPASWLAQPNIWEFNAGDQLGLARCFERFANYPLWCLTQCNFMVGDA